MSEIQREHLPPGSSGNRRHAPSPSWKVFSQPPPACSSPASQAAPISGTGGPLTPRSIATNLQLNNFIHWVSDYCKAQHRNDASPPVDGRPWRLSTRQFRRTLAWFIARHPGGAIAGAIAYPHLSIQMFEGYAGTSDSGFHAEVESEQALARGEHLLAMIDSYEHAGLIGPATDEATRRLEQFAAQASFNGKVITDDRRLLRLMRRDDPAIYPGRYVTCVHSHAAALCRQHRNTNGKAIPTPSDLRPLSCRK